MADEPTPEIHVTMYESDSGAIELQLDAERQTAWVTQANMATLFGVDRSVISKHLSNIFEEGELDKE